MYVFLQAENGIREAQESHGLGDVYVRQGVTDDLLAIWPCNWSPMQKSSTQIKVGPGGSEASFSPLYTSDAADE